jgi:hypothetical protein
MDLINTSDRDLYKLYSNGNFNNSDFIPYQIIPEIIKHTLPDSIILHNYSDIHYIIKCSIMNLFNLNVVNWKYNRPPDMTRCNDIASYIYNRKSYIDSMIYITFNHKEKKFEVYDGIHRLNALSILKVNNTNIIENGEIIINESIFWLYSSNIILNVRFNSTDADIIEAFKTLNKSSPIPDIYIRNETTERKKIIETVAIEWQNKYNSHFVPTSRPYRPNINRDKFIELLDFIYDKYNIANTSRSLSQIMKTANTNISLNIPSKIKLTQQIIDKCSSTGCWMFIYTIEELKNKI